MENDNSKQDVVNHPSHYTNALVECIVALEASMTPDQFEGYLKGNVEKYIWRYNEKNGVEDLMKAQWYLAKLINFKEGQEAQKLVQKG